MKHEIEIYLTKDKMPEPWVTVIVDGIQIAQWTGKEWLSRMDLRIYAPIGSVYWWTPMLTHED